jgi:hypothetical protein
MITVKAVGSFNNTIRFLQKLSKGDIYKILDSYGQKGVDALSAATPIETGATAHSWYYKVEQTNNSHKISWHNSHMAGNVPLVILLQYGHGTRTGGYVPARDFINPAMRPIFDAILAEIKKEVLG